jgi:catecholate siderophore receptor
MKQKHGRRYSASNTGFLGLVALLAAGSASAAEEAPAASESSSSSDFEQRAAQLPTVYVTGKRPEGYNVDRSTTAMRTNTPLRDIPQSMTLISSALIRDQSMQSITDVIRYAPGVGTSQGENNRDTVVLRGTTSTSDFFVNGVRDDVQYFRDLYNVDVVEVLKGPNAMIFGRGGGGGVINRVTKVADWVPTHEVALQTGSYSDARITTDIGGAFSDGFAGRITAMYEKTDGYRDGYSLERYGVNPTASFKTSDRTVVTLGYELYHDERTADRGIPSLNGRPYPTDASTFFGDPSQSFAKADVGALNALVEHDFGGGLTLRNNTRYGDYDRMYQNFVPGAVAAGSGTVPITAYNNATLRENLFNQTDFVWVKEIGAMQHTFLGGIEVGRQDSVNHRNTGFFAIGPNTNSAGTTYNAPLTVPTFHAAVDFHSNGTTDADNNGITDIVAVYVQDQIDLTSMIELVAGLRYDSFRVNFNDTRPTPTGIGNVKTSDGLVSPRVGLILKPTESISAYASYSVAFTPRAGEQLASLTNFNKALEPEEYRNVEIGTKWDISRALSFTTAVYRQDRTNVAVADATPGAPAGQLVLVDGQRVKGVEVGLSGRVTPKWSMAGGYAHQDGEISSDQSATVRKGASLAQTPTNTFSFWNRYDFTPKFGVGIGIINRDDMFAATENVLTAASNVTLPGYTRVDAAVFMTFHGMFSAQVNVENLLDKNYYLNADNNNNITPGAPRAVRVTLGAKF